MSLRLIISIAAITFMAIFVLQNMEMVSVVFLVWSIEASRVVIYLTIFLAGALTGWLGHSIRRRSR